MNFNQYTTDIDFLCENIRALVAHSEEKARAAQFELQKLSDEKWKDKELQRMQEALNKKTEDLLRGFPISEREEKAIQKWQDQHYTNQHFAPDLDKRIRMQGVSGGLFTYIFLPTTLGTSGVCRCNSCYKKALTEVGNSNNYKTASAYYDAYENTIRKFDAEFEFQQIG